MTSEKQDRDESGRFVKFMDDVFVARKEYELAIEEMTGQNRLRSEAFAHYQTAEKMSHSLLMRLGNQELPKHYSQFLGVFSDESANAKKLYNKLVHARLSNSQVFSLRPVHKKNIPIQGGTA